jgi:hypothetical protein
VILLQENAVTTPDLRTNRTPDPIERIVLWAAPTAGIAFALGFFGPMLLSTSNLGPLLGIFVTGPIGALLGTLVGALSVARDSIRTSIIAIAAAWLLTLGYIWLAMSLAVFAAVVLPLQFAVMAATASILLWPSTRTQLSDDAWRCGLVAMAAQAIILVTTLFPPVVRPWWGPATSEPAAPLPLFAFILDLRFNGSRNIPLMVPNRPELALEWLVTMVAALGLAWLLRSLGRRPAARS